MKPLLNTLDIILGHFVRGLITFFLYVFIGLLATASLLIIPISFFEYNSGIADLDLAEIGLFILLLATVWRFYNRCQHVALTWWQGLKRFALAVAFAELIYTFIYFYIVYFVISEQGEIGVAFFERNTDLEIFTSVLFSIVAIYAATPLPSLVKDKEPELIDAPQSSFNDEQAQTPAPVLPQSI